MGKLIWLAEKYFTLLLFTSLFMLFFNYHYYWILTFIGSIILVVYLWKAEDNYNERLEQGE